MFQVGGTNFKRLSCSTSNFLGCADAVMSVLDEGGSHQPALEVLKVDFWIHKKKQKVPGKT